MADAVAEELVRRAAAGDAAARRRLVEATIDDLWALAMRLVQREDNADEIVQETYARALANLADWTPRGRFEGYLARIATNLVLERWRRARPAVPLDPH
ncbi:MAG: sigma factor, partial [Phycisphaerae bacterium]